MTTQLTLFSDSPAKSRQHKPVSQKRIRRLFWTSMKHPSRTPQSILITSPAGLKLAPNYRLYLHIAGWYNLTRLTDSADVWWSWMYTRRDRLWKLIKGYDKRGNKEKADYYYSLYQSHTYHL